MVFSIMRAGLKIVHVKPETREEAEEHETLKPTKDPFMPLYHPRQSFSDKECHHWYLVKPIKTPQS